MIKIIAIDKIKEKSIKENIQIYLDRLENRQKISIIEIPPAKYYNTDNDLTMIEKAKTLEAEKIIKSIKSFKNEKNTLLIVLDESGLQYNSTDFSRLIFETNHQKDLIFIIGGAYGLSDSVIKKADIVLSLSKMTFTHEMIRLFLIEQIYRGYAIYKNIKYHH